MNSEKSKSFAGARNYRKTSFVSLSESIPLFGKRNLKEVGKAWTAR